ncbi:MAG: tetratricopeptide repeat protein [Nitrospinaceae bacterium]
MTTALFLILLVLGGLAIAKVVLLDKPGKKIPDARPDSTGSRKGGPETASNNSLESDGEKCFKKALNISEETRFPKVALHRLPPDPEVFFGRKGFQNAMPSSGGKKPALIGLYGMEGIGKTALGVRMARNLLPGYRDDQIYFDMRGTTAHPVSPEEVMARVIHLYRPLERLSSRLEDLQGMYRFVLKKQKVILFLDNPPNIAAVKTLAPPAHCLVIVASSKPLSLPGQNSIKLNPLTPNESQSLLLALTPRIGFWIREISKLCLGHPLALTLAARFISAAKGYDPSHYVDSLRDEINRLKSQTGNGLQSVMDAAFTLTYKQLPQKTALVLRKLILLPETFDAKAEAFICEDDDNGHLTTLMMYGLVGNNRNDNRFYLHGQVRRYLESRRRKSEMALAEKKFATYYLTLLISARDFYERGGEGMERGLNLFDLEWENIRTGFAWAQAHCQKDSEAEKLAVAYGEEGAPLLILRQPPQEIIRWFEGVLNIARRMKENQTVNKFLLNLGWEWNKMGQPERARKYLEEALDLSRKLQDTPAEIKVLDCLGSTQRTLGKPHGAIELLENEWKLMKDFGNTAGEEDVLKSLGELYHQVGEDQRALEYFKIELEWAREKEDSPRQGRILGDLGNVYASLGDSGSAMEFFEQGLAFARESGNKSEECRLLKRLGDAHGELGVPRKGIPSYREGLELARAVGDHQAAGSMMLRIGEILAEEKKYGEAVEWYRKAVILFQKTTERRKEAETLWNLSLALDRSGNQTEAVRRARSALQIFRELNRPEVREIREQLTAWEAAQEASPQKPLETSAPEKT